jgi:CheY-like chemotaxis protein
MEKVVMSNIQAVTILLVEDDPGHARLIEKNLRRSNITNDIVRFESGRTALDFLFKTGEYEGSSHASSMLVLLDLNLPGMDGYQILQHMKQDERTKRIPVVILTTTDDVREVEKCYDLGCNVYITKPIDYAQFSQAIRKIGLFLSVVTVPGA